MKRLYWLILIVMLTAAVARAQPTATSFSSTVSTVGSSAISLIGTVDSGTLTFGTHLRLRSCVQPTHGKLSQFNPSSGIVIYTPDSGYTGADSFGFTAIKDGSTSSAEATVTITVTSAKTTITDKLLNADGSARTGKVTWVLTQPANSPEGLIPASATVTSDLTAGAFTVVSLPDALSLAADLLSALVWGRVESEERTHRRFRHTGRLSDYHVDPALPGHRYESSDALQLRGVRRVPSIRHEGE